MDTNKKVLESEQRYLNYALKAMEWEREHQKDQLTTLPRVYRDDPRLLEILMTLSATRLKRIENLSDKPYFARIDFSENGKPFKIYIGKTSISDEQGNDAVVDWRAPICTLYYDSNLGQTSYIAPIGEIDGELILKRQLIIEDKRVQEYYDVDSVSDDELLKPYLGANADNRLKSIVASIGKEQNQIIRSSFHTNIIVQGVAGSGKTTVALHRAAYLIYNEKDKCKPHQFMVIGPNRYFIRYIATVLPDLEAEEIGQSIFEDIATNFVGEKLKCATGSISLDNVMAGKADTKLHGFKTSLKYKEAIDCFFDDFTKSLFHGDIEVAGVTIISENELMATFISHSIVSNLKARISQTILTISNKIKYEHDIILKKVRASYKPLITASPKGEVLIKLYEQLHKDEKDVENGCVKMMNEYFNKVNISITAMYKKFAECMEKYVSEFETAKEEIMKNLAKKTITFEDTPAIIYLKLLLNGAGNYTEYRHVLVDEAQDLGLFHFYCLKKLFSNSTFTIVGDLAQGIYSYRSIENWQEVFDNIFTNYSEYLQLDKSYRTTIEIMECANTALKALGTAPAIPVIRHGDEPRFITMDSKNYADHIVKTVDHYKTSGLKSFAVITKTQKQAQKIHKELILLNPDCGFIEENKAISILTGYQAKGLEFDFVFIIDGDNENYNPTSTLDMRLLFVSMSRALHQMEILLGK